VIRYYLQSTHYRSPIEWNEDRLREAGIAYARLRAAIETGEKAGGDGAIPESVKPKGLHLDALKTEKLFEEAMETTSLGQGAGASLRSRQGDQSRDESGSGDGDRAALPLATRTLRRLGETLGLFWGESPRNRSPGGRPIPCETTR